MSFFRVRGEGPGGVGKVTEVRVSTLGPDRRADRTMAIIPVFTPVVAPVTYAEIEEPTFAGLAAVAIITSSS